MSVQELCISLVESVLQVESTSGKKEGKKRGVQSLMPVLKRKSSFGT